MDGVHDMGGMDGFGKVVPEPNEPPFHAAWEGRVLAHAAGHVLCRRVADRHVALRRRNSCRRRSISPSSYYQRWELAMERNVIERGLADADELAAGHAQHAGKPLKRKLTADNFAESMTRGSFYRQAQAPARFKPGDRVRTSNIHPADPYAAAALCARAHSAWSSWCTAATLFPIRSQSTKGTIRSGSTRSCSKGASSGVRMPTRRVKVSIDAFEPYLEPA